MMWRLAAQSQARRWRGSLPLLLALTLGFSASPGRAQSAAATSPEPAALPASAPAPPRPIPAPEIARSADELDGELRAVERRAQTPAPVTAIARDLPVRSERISRRLAESRLVLAERVTDLALDQLAQGWLPVRAALDAWSETVARYASAMEAELAGLAARQDLWQRSLDALLASDEPPEVTGRAQGAIAALEATRQRVQGRRNAALLLQDAVEHARACCTSILAEIEQARESAGGLLARDGDSIFGLVRARAEEGPVRDRVARTLDLERAEAIFYAREHLGRCLGHALVLLALLVGFLRLRGLGRSRRGPQAELPATAATLELPYSSAFLLAALATLWIHPDAPLWLRWVAAAVALIPLIRILRRLAPPPLRLPVLALGVLFVLDRGARLLATVPRLEQALFLVEVALWLAIAAGVLARDRTLRRRGSPGLAAWQRRALRGLAGILALSFGAGAAGYLRLAHELGEAMRVVYAAMVFTAVAGVANGVVGAALRMPPLAKVRAIARHSAAVERGLSGAVGVAAALGTAFLALGLLGAWEPFRDALVAAVGADLVPGAVHVSLGGVLAFFATVWASFAVSRCVRFVLEEDVYPRATLRRGVPYAVSTLLHYVILTAGFFLGITILGVGLDRITLLTGAFGVGIGFGLQNVIQNFASGLILLFERPVQVGDRIQLGTLEGEVLRIGMRSCTLRTGDGAEVIVPNADLITERVTNWTLSDRLRRVDVPVGVAHGSDPELVLRVLREVVGLHPDVCAAPPPVALFIGFGSGSLDFRLSAWTEAADWTRVRSDLGIRVNAALRDEGVRFPAPPGDAAGKGP